MADSAPTPSRQQSNTAAWLSAHGDALYRYALLHTGDPTAAEDAVQETLLAALQSAGDFEHRSSERTWLISILRHKLIDRLRRVARAPDAAGGDEQVAAQFSAGGAWSTAPRAWARDPAQAAAQREFWDVLADCLARLPARLAFAFCQRELGDCPTAEVCEVLGVSPTNLWTLLHRARTRLRSCLEVHWFRTDE